MEFGKLHADLRERKGVSQYEMAKETGIDRSVIADWEQNRSGSYTKYLPKLAEYFSVDISVLTGQTILDKTLAEQLMDLAEQFYSSNITALDALDMQMTLNNIFVRSQTKKLSK